MFRSQSHGSLSLVMAHGDGEEGSSFALVVLTLSILQRDSYVMRSLSNLLVVDLCFSVLLFT